MRSMYFLTVAAIVLMAKPAPAQVKVGGHYARAAEAFDGTNGIGARLRLGAPLVPIFAAVNGEYFFADCDPGDCSLYGATFDLNYALPFPVLQTYVGLGWSIRKVEVDSDSRTKSGLNLGVGAELKLIGIQPYADLRYELVDAPEKQLLFRLGIMF